MEANTQNKTHPLIITAAVAVTAVSLAGLGAILGVIPTAGQKPAPAVEAAAVPATTAAAATEAPATTKVTADPQATLAVPAGSAVLIETPAAKSAASEPAARAKPQPAVREKQREPAPPAVPTTQRSNQVRVTQQEPASVSAERADSARRTAVCKDCGTIDAVREVRKEGEGSGIGAVAGGVLGGVVGNQMGKGHGKDAMTVIGALGGAYAGHQVEKSQRAGREYEVTVRYDDGTTQTFKQATAPAWREGDRVRVRSGEITAAN